ncbi:MAG: hypothetical protein PHG27_06550 [Massilibacteroides sp.]|nr:hypothetical protein [Massilibacteroides sp.]
MTKLSTPEEMNADIQLAPFSVDPLKWGKFLCTLFDEWVKQDVVRLQILWNG